MTPLSTTHYRGCKIEIYHDEDCTSPREWDNIGTISCWNERYTLGDTQPDVRPQAYFEQIIIQNKAFYLPLYAYIHGGIALSTRPFECQWDSGQVGYIWCPLERAIKEWRLGPDADWNTMLTSVGNLPEETLGARVMRVLEGEIKTYDKYLQGECYGYKVIGLDGEELDSCWGFIGTDQHEYIIDFAKSTIDRHVEDPANHEQQGEH